METNLESFILCMSIDMRTQRQYSTAKTCVSVLRGLSGVAQRKSLTFSELTPELLATYEHHLLSRGRSRNTVSLYMRTLHNVCNRAEHEKLATVPANLFEKVFTGADPVRHRAVAPDLIRQISTLELVGKQARLQFSRDMFMLCFYLRGIAFIDLAHLRKGDLDGDVISYWRQKTKKVTSLKIDPRAMEIIKRYAHLAENTIYLLPIIRVQGTADEERKQYESALRLYNKHLNRIGVILNLDMPLTSYVARHSWATIAHNIGVQMADISEALCHSSEKMTRNYIRSFTADRLAEVNQRVIAFVMGKEAGKKASKEVSKGRQNPQRNSVKKRKKVVKKNRSGSL